MINISSTGIGYSSFGVKKFKFLKSIQTLRVPFFLITRTKLAYHSTYIIGLMNLFFQQYFDFFLDLRHDTWRKYSRGLLYRPLVRLDQKSQLHQLLSKSRHLMVILCKLVFKLLWYLDYSCVQGWVEFDTYVSWHFSRPFFQICVSGSLSKPKGSSSYIQSSLRLSEAVSWPFWTICLRTLDSVASTTIIPCDSWPVCFGF